MGRPLLQPRRRFADHSGWWKPVVGVPLAALLFLAQPLPEDGAALAGGGTRPPELEGGTDWLGTGGVHLTWKDFKGKIVVLDFWTLC